MRGIQRDRSVFVWTASATTGLVKLGHPVPLSSLSVDENRGCPETTSTYRPSSWLSQYSLRKAGSVPSFWVTRYCWSLRRLRASEVLL